MLTLIESFITFKVYLFLMQSHKANYLPVHLQPHNYVSVSYAHNKGTCKLGMQTGYNEL